MGLLDRFRRQAEEPRLSNIDTSSKKIIVGSADDTLQAFDNGNITYRGELRGYDYLRILRDKQRFIYDIYSLADFYFDFDEILHGILHNVYVPYSTCSPHTIINVPEKTRKLYEEHYKKIHLDEKILSIMLQYFKYGNVFVYYLDKNIITLPPHKCRIGNVMLNGDPVVDFDCMSVYAEYKQKGYVVKENWIKDNNLETVFKGYPPEIVDQLNDVKEYIQLNPENTYVMQGPKEDWMRYAIPFIACCLPFLAKKSLISKYQDAMLNLGIHSFVHAKYGDPKSDILPDGLQLGQAHKIISKAMQGFPLATTNHLVDVTVVKPDNDDLFQWPMYSEVNESILSAGGISGILVSGNAIGGSNFSTAQVSMETAAARIESAREQFCEMMNRINKRILVDLKIDHKNNLKQQPEFIFMPLDMSGKKALREACQQLWQKGLISTKTLMESNGYSIDREFELRKQEDKNGITETMIPRETVINTMIQQTEQDEAGRPELKDQERVSDPQNAIRGKMPKPSSPEGSLDSIDMS